jgi:hypothetical protein
MKRQPKTESPGRQSANEPRIGRGTSVSQPNFYHTKSLTVSYVAMVQCLRCRQRIPIEVNLEELQQLRAFKRLVRFCQQCSQDTEWQYLPLGVSR